MRRIYATPAQLTVWLGHAAPCESERMLARASEDIDAALLTAVYEVDDHGWPVDPCIAQALADATCAQVEYWLATGSDGVIAAEQWNAVSIGPVSLSGRSSAPAPTVANGVELAPRAARTLRDAGLTPGVVFPW